MESKEFESLIHESSDPYIRILKKCVLISVKILALFMVVVVWLSLLDVIAHLYYHIQQPFTSIFNVEMLISTLGDFLAVLIAIEIFLNIIFFLNKDSIHVALVLATALTAAARKIIIMDYKTIEFHTIYGTAAVIMALGLTYWLVTKNPKVK